MIRNLEQLATTTLRRKALQIADAGYRAIEIEPVIRKKIKRQGDSISISCGAPLASLTVDLSRFDRVFLIGIGKGSALACETFSKILGNKLTQGITLDTIKLKTSTKNGSVSGAKSSKLKTYAGTHPIASNENIKGTQEIIKLAKGLTEKDLLFAFICGGGSALAVGSKKEVQDIARATKALTKGGADILELNTLRKHLSEIKGGGLARLAHPAKVISLIVSDVLENDLSMIASGPTTKDNTTQDDAVRIIKKYKMDPKNFSLRDTPRDEGIFKNAKNILFLSNKEPAEAMAGKAKSLGFRPLIKTLALQGEASAALSPYAQAARTGQAIIAGGEATVTLEPVLSIKHKVLGKGGRNQEAVLGAICAMLNTDHSPLDTVFISIASDGRDNTEAAGAIGDYLVPEKAKKMKLDPKEFLKNHDSFNFFKKTGDLIFAERESFNVADLMLVIKGR